MTALYVCICNTLCVGTCAVLITHLYLSMYVMCRRNQNFGDILRLLSLGDKQLGPFDISLRFTHLFWCGDLNYRLDLDVQVRRAVIISLSFIVLFFF